MDLPSSRELLQKAGSRARNADRWAALQSGEKAEIRAEIKTDTKIRKIEKEEEPSAKEIISKNTQARSTAAEWEGQSAKTPYVPGHPNLKEPPFPPPQARHTALDAIQQKHIQALQSAMPAQEWKKREEKKRQRQADDE